jgi:hypothetical protein
MTKREFRRTANKAINKMVWAQLQAEELVYRAREALARAEAAELAAATAYRCGIEGMQYLAERVEGTKVTGG